MTFLRKLEVACGAGTAMLGIAAAVHMLSTDLDTMRRLEREFSVIKELLGASKGSISGSSSFSPTGLVDLTAEGVLDWAHWGLSGPTSFDHKAGVTQQISNFTPIGTGALGWFADSSTTCSWTDGTPTLTESNTATGINVNGAVGNGLEISVPADTNLRTLKFMSECGTRKEN